MNTRLRKLDVGQRVRLRIDPERWPRLAELDGEPGEVVSFSPNRPTEYQYGVALDGEEPRTVLRFGRQELQPI